MGVVELWNTRTQPWKVEIEAILTLIHIKTLLFRLHFLGVDQGSPVEKESCALNSDQQR